MYKDTIKKERRTKRKARIAAKIRGTSQKPRLAVFRSNRYLSVQVIDDVGGVTMLSAMTKGKNKQHAQELGAHIAKMLIEKNMKHIVFDRGGYRYHGSIKAFADAAREGGVQF